MKLKVRVDHLIVIFLLFLAFRLYLLKFVYLAILPGFCITLILAKYDFKKTLLLSFPVSIIFFSYPYFLITRSLMPINPWVYFCIPGILFLISYFKGFISFSFSNHINYKNLVYVLIPLISLLLIYSPYLTRGSVSLTAGTNELLFTKIHAESIINKGVIPVWSESEYAGSHFFYTFPPLSHVTTALLNVIPTESINYTVNFTVVALYAYMLFAVYMLLSYLGLRVDSSVLGASILIGVPLLAGEPTFSGNLTMAYMFALYPVAVYGFFNIFRRSSLKDLFFMALTVSAFMTVYHYISYFMLIPAFVTLFFYLFSKDRLLYFKNAVFFFLIIGLLFGAWFIRYYLIRDYLTIIGWEGNWNIPLKDFGEFLSFIAASGREVDDVYKQIITFTPLFFWAGFISMFLIFRVKKGNLLFNSQDLLVFVYSVFVFLLVISEIFPFHTILPLRENYYKVFKFWDVLIPLFAFAIARFYENLTNIFKFSSFWVFLVFFLVFVPMMLLSAENVSKWLVERAIIENLFGDIPLFIKGLDGRLAIFGGFGPALNPSFYNWSGQNLMMGYGFQRHSSRLVYENILENFTDAGMDYVKDGVLPVRLFNSFWVTGTNTILFFNCYPNGDNALNVTLGYPGYGLKFYDNQCTVILNLSLKSPLVQTINLTKVPNDSKPFLLDLEDGFAVVTPYHDINDSEYSFEFGGVINYSYFELSYNFNSEGLTIFNSIPGWILYKGAYFPTLHAYQDGKELFVTPSYHGLTLIKSVSNSPITVKHLPHYSEFIGLGIYLIFLIISFFVFRVC